MLSSRAGAEALSGSRGFSKERAGDDEQLFGSNAPGAGRTNWSTNESLPEGDAAPSRQAEHAQSLRSPGTGRQTSCRGDRGGIPAGIGQRHFYPQRVRSPAGSPPGGTPDYNIPGHPATGEKRRLLYPQLRILNTPP